MSFNFSLPRSIAEEIGEISDADEGAQLRALRTRARAQNATPDQILAAELAGIAMNPVAYARFDTRLRMLFTYRSNLNYPLDGTVVPEVVIGTGFHAADYCAVRHLAGKPAPLVLEETETPGGVFAVTQNPSFFLNSENTGGLPGSPWDGAANALNWLPGAPVQPAQISGRELQDNTVLRFVIRATLMLHARVIIRARVTSIPGRRRDVDPLVLTLQDGRTITCDRVIDARGMGPDAAAAAADGTKILTWSQAMGQMDTNFPFAGMGRVAVVGNGKSALCAAEALLGIGPDVTMRTASAGQPHRVDLYAPGLPRDQETWLSKVQARYARLASHLPRIGTGITAFHDLYVLPERGQPVAVPGGVLVNGRFYDHVIMCTGHTPPADLTAPVYYDLYRVGSSRAVACKHPSREIYRIGPHADLPWSDAEYSDGITVNPENQVSMFRLGPLTATLAAALP